MSANFELVPSRRQEVVPLLKAIPGFVSSEDYRLHAGEMDALPGVILASFARFLIRLSHSSPGSSSLHGGLGAIADMLDWNDGEVTASIQEEFFEVLTDNPGGDGVVARMKPALGEAYARCRAQDG